MRVEVVGRVPGKCVYLRLPYRKSHRIIQVPDDVLPYGMKTATGVEIEWNGVFIEDGPGYTAIVNVVGESVAESTEELSQGH